MYCMYICAHTDTLPYILENIYYYISYIMYNYMSVSLCRYSDVSSYASMFCASMYVIILIFDFFTSSF